MQPTRAFCTIIGPASSFCERPVKWQLSSTVLKPLRNMVPELPT